MTRAIDIFKIYGYTNECIDVCYVYEFCNRNMAVAVQEVERWFPNGELCQVFICAQMFMRKGRFPDLMIERAVQQTVDKMSH
jgi:hypothetical protein